MNEKLTNKKYYLKLICIKEIFYCFSLYSFFFQILSSKYTNIIHNTTVASDIDRRLFMFVLIVWWLRVCTRTSKVIFIFGYCHLTIWHKWPVFIVTRTTLTYVGWMNTEEDLSQVDNDAINSSEIVVDDPSLFDGNSDTLVPITKVSTNTVR